MLKQDWEFNVLGVYNYHNKHGYLRHYFDYIIKNHDRIKGDIVEAGVYNGRSLLATGLLLKELGSSKQVYGYDCFSGFPSIHHNNDDLERFDDLFAAKNISLEHYNEVQKLIKYTSIKLGGEEKVTVNNISMSGDFSGVSLSLLTKKISFLGLDNIHLVKGNFDETMNENCSDKLDDIFAVLMDCDLYTSHMITLDFIWPKLNNGGYIYFDEYYSLKFPGSRIATNEFFMDKIEKPKMYKKIIGDFERWGVTKST